MSINLGYACPESLIAHGLKHLTGVRRVIALFPVGHQICLLVPRS